MTLPTLAEIEALHRKCAPTDEAFRSVYEHCTIVADIADQLLTRRTQSVDRDMVRAGCLLHDIGVYALYANGELDTKNYIRHGVLGAEILRKEGFAEPLCRFCSHHTGVGLPKAQIIARNLPLPHEDFLAETAEEEIVMFADKFHSKTVPPRFNAPEAYAEHLRQFGEENVAMFAKFIEKYGLPDLDALSLKYGHKVLTHVTVH